MRNMLGWGLKVKGQKVCGKNDLSIDNRSMGGDLFKGGR